MKLYEKYLRKDNEKLNYLVYAPENLSDSLPLILFLHGAGERGMHTENLYRHGIAKMIKEGYEIPAIVLIPQCHENLVWNNLVRELGDLTDKIAEKYNADKAKISVTGGSMGGFGTWEMGLTYPNKFSVIAPICGGGLSWRAANLKNTPVFAYHGALDDCVPLVYSELMVDAVNKNGGNACLTVFPDNWHNDTIQKAYYETDLIEKLISTVRTDFAEIPEAFSDCFNKD